MDPDTGREEGASGRGNISRWSIEHPYIVIAFYLGVGVLSDCRGPWAFAFEDTIAGAELALIEHGGRLVGRAVTSGVRDVKINGHPVRIFLGCTDGTNASALAEARRLVDEVNRLIGQETVRNVAVRQHRGRDQAP